MDIQHLQRRVVPPDHLSATLTDSISKRILGDTATIITSTCQSALSVKIERTCEELFVDSARTWPLTSVEGILLPFNRSECADAKSFLQ